MPSAMMAVLLQFWRVCLLRQGPESIPGYAWFAILVTALNVLISMILRVNLDPESNVLEAATVITVNVATQATLLWATLYFKDLTRRFQTVLTALFGCDLIVTVLIAVTVIVGETLFGSVSPAVQIPFLIWLFAIIGFILHRALDVALGIGVVIGFGIYFMAIVVSQAAIS